MKKLMFLLISITTLACTNPKEQINYTEKHYAKMLNELRTNTDLLHLMNFASALDDHIDAYRHILIYHENEINQEEYEIYEQQVQTLDLIRERIIQSLKEKIKEDR